jgi:hypothetical protein
LNNNHVFLYHRKAHILLSLKAECKEKSYGYSKPYCIVTTARPIPKPMDNAATEDFQFDFSFMIHVFMSI